MAAHLLSWASARADLGFAAERRLRESPYFFFRNLHCHYGGGVLTVSGSVPSYKLRSLAESLIARVPGVTEIVNHIDVIDPAGAPFMPQEVRTAG
jgi:hypothetical protein